MLPWHIHYFKLVIFLKTSDVTEALKIEYKLAFCKKKLQPEPFGDIAPTASSDEHGSSAYGGAGE